MSIKTPQAPSTSSETNSSAAMTGLNVAHGAAQSSASPKMFAHIPFLDGLRALSIFAVLTFHSGGPIGKLLFRQGGWVGVDAFFVISGFLITAILLKEQDKTSTIQLKNFYVRRALRLMPAFTLWIVVTSVMRLLQHKFSLPAAAIAAVYMCDYDLALNWGHIMGSGFEIAWSLSVEEKFYLIWPSIAKTCRKFLPLVGVGAIVCCFAWRAYLLTHGANWLRICGAFDCKIDALMIGCVSAMLLNNQKVKTWLERNIRTSLFSVALLVFALFYIRGMGHPSGAHSLHEQLMYWNVRLPVFTLTIAALIVTLSARPIGLAGRILSFPPIAWIGKISYSLYLWHIVGFAFALWFGWRIHPMVPIEMEVAQYFWSIVFAAVSFYVVEQPFLKMKNRFSIATLTPVSIGKELNPSSGSRVRSARAAELIASSREKGL